MLGVSGWMPYVPVFKWSLPSASEVAIICSHFIDTQTKVKRLKILPKVTVAGQETDMVPCASFKARLILLTAWPTILKSELKHQIEIFHNCIICSFKPEIASHVGSWPLPSFVLGQGTKRSLCPLWLCLSSGRLPMEDCQLIPY